MLFVCLKALVWSKPNANRISASIISASLVHRNLWKPLQPLVLVKIGSSGVVCPQTRRLCKSERERISFSRTSTRIWEYICKQKYSCSVVRLPQENWFCPSSVLSIVFWLIVLYFFGSMVLFPACSYCDTEIKSFPILDFLQSQTEPCSALRCTTFIMQQHF